MASKQQAIIELLIQDRQATRSLKGLNAQLKGFGKNVPHADQLAKSFAKGSTQIRGTTTSVINLSRIIQDAPFGIMGVGNNIMPMIEGFQNMGDEATTAGAKIKALIKGAFTGPTALITIVSLATAAFTAYQMGLFDMGEEAETAEEKLRGVLDTIRTIIKVQKEFGMFKDDKLGIATIQQEMKLIAEQQRALEKNMARAAALEKQLGKLAPTISPQTAPRFKALQEELDRLGDREKMQEEYNELQAELVNKSLELRDIYAAMSRSDTKRVEDKKEEKKEQEQITRLTKEQYQAMVDAARMEGVTQPGTEIIMADLFKGIPQSELDKELAKLQALFSKYEELQEQIKDTSGESQTGAMAIRTLGDAFAQAALHGDNLLDVVKNLAKQLAARAIVEGLAALLTSGASLGKSSFLGRVFGFAHGTDMGFPGLGMAGERGRELVVAPPYSSIITNENLRKMESGAMAGAGNLMGFNAAGQASVMKEAIKEGFRESDLSIDINTIDKKLANLREFKANL